MDIHISFIVYQVAVVNVVQSNMSGKEVLSKFLPSCRTYFLLELYWMKPYFKTKVLKGVE